VESDGGNKKGGMALQPSRPNLPIYSDYPRWPVARLLNFLFLKLTRLFFIDSTFTPFTSPSTGLEATFAFLAVFKVLINDFFSIDMSAFPRRNFEFFVLPSDALYICTARAKLRDLHESRSEKQPPRKINNLRNPTAPENSRRG
jgi:hypothetical protein